MKKRGLINFFKKCPKAAILAVILVAAVETISYSLLAMAKQGGKEDLVRMDTNFFNINFKKYASGLIADINYLSEPHYSWKSFWDDAPYDVIVVGTSVGMTGWVKMIQLKYGLKILNSTANYILFNDFIKAPIAAIANGNNKNKTAVLLAVGITERTGLDLHPHDEVKKLLDHSVRKGLLWEWRTCLHRLRLYLSKKNELRKKPLVKILNIHGRDELFYIPDCTALSQKIIYSLPEYHQLSQQLKDVRDLAKENGFIYAIVIFPTKAQMYEWLLIENGYRTSVSPRTSLKTLKKAALENSIPLLDLEEELKPKAKTLFQKNGRLLWPQADTHMNELGNRLAAEKIKLFIDEINKKN